MTDEVKLRQQADRGERAKRVLENELVKEAFESMEKTIMDAWRLSAADEDGARNNAYLMYRLLQNLKQQFAHMVATGEAANKQLLQINDPSKIRRMISGR